MSRSLIYVGQTRMGPYEMYACEKCRFHILYSFPEIQDDIADKTTTINK